MGHAMRKTFIGPHLRRLRQDRAETQAAMARMLGVSAAYVNLLENNQRSVSVAILLRLMEVYGVDWRDIAQDDGSARLADLRGALADPLFEGDRPDLTQLRAAQSHAPTLLAAFLRLHRAYLAASDQVQAMAAQTTGAEPVIGGSAEGAVHDFFRRHRNHFRELELAADSVWPSRRPASDDMGAALKDRLRQRHGIAVRLVQMAEMPDSLRELDEARRELRLSEALDHPNRAFQMAHVLGLLEFRDVIDGLLTRGNLGGEGGDALGGDTAGGRGRARALVELANYFAAALLMPYDAFLSLARVTLYDIDQLATRFGVSFEQACHRATTLQREGAQGVPFFFLRIDRAGNVTKRFNATDFQLAEYGGACPRLDVHTTFRVPGQIVPQFVEMPDSSQYFVFARTVDRPRLGRHVQDTGLAVAMGCTIEHAAAIGYAEGLSPTAARLVPIGINCRICPRAQCAQRAHHAAILTAPLDARRRGATRYDS
jgi:XRE family transcriptional regulator, fatty acid utilization regulator